MHSYARVSLSKLAAAIRFFHTLHTGVHMAEKVAILTHPTASLHSGFNHRQNVQNFRTLLDFSGLFWALLTFSKPFLDFSGLF
jgi:hypothetical protein